ncbi:hypothetical protein AB0G42_21545 [Streptomyces yangpuensis]|uniref:hypothetical protein n=1 Tax=Streptomyces yangpuensis TaxID=1648182 RepID=UPI0034427421
MAEFQVGQQVSYRGMRMPAEIVSGPHRSPGRPRYLIEKADGNVSLVSEVDLTRVVSRLDRVAEAIAENVHGRPYRTLPLISRGRIALAAQKAIDIADSTRGQ